MRLLVLTLSPPFPGGYGGAQRTQALLEALAEGHEVILSAPMDPAVRGAAEQHLRALAHAFAWVDPVDAVPLRLPTAGSRLARVRRYGHDLATTGLPYAFRRRSTTWQSQIVPLLPEVDGVLLRHAMLGTLLDRASWDRAIIDADDLSFRACWTEARSGMHGWGAAILLVEAARTYLAEQRLLRRARRVLVASQEHGRLVRARAITVVPNGVTPPAGEMPAPHPDAMGVVFVGHCGYEPNRHGLDWFLRTVWPSLRAAQPALTFAIVGRDATSTTVPAAAGAPGVTLHPDVESVAPYLVGASVSVAPLFFGAGTRIKVLEALAFGVPVVATSFGAEGLEDTLGPTHGLHRADRPTEMIRTILDVLAAPTVARAQARRGANLVGDCFSWRAATEPVRECIGEWLSPAGEPRRNFS